MAAKTCYGIGLMSGTSADGIDAALVKFEEAPFGAVLEAFDALPYPARLRDRILAAPSPKTPLEEMGELHVLVAEAFARAALALLKKARFPARQVDFIGSHGQTLFHFPPSRANRNVPFTVQAGDGSVLAQKTGILTVSDFRIADLAQGGEGAPLVPYVDWRLYTHPKKGRILLNLGGIANFTYLPPGCGLDEVAGCDTGPGNALLDALAYQVTGGAQTCDVQGGLAARGEIRPEILDDLLSHPFLRRSPPKSADRSWFAEALASRLLKKHPKVPPPDLLATAVALTAESVATHLARHAQGAHEVYVSGGGANNPVLMRLLQTRIEARLGWRIPIYRADALGIPAKVKEAFAFAFLAYETLKGRGSNVPNVTGAKRHCVLGKIAPGWHRTWKLL